MGAKIEGDGTTTIRIRGVTALHAATHAVMPDRIETGSYLVAGAVTRGRVRVNKTDPAVMDAVLVKLQQAGAKISTGTAFVEVDTQGRRPLAVNIPKLLHPGFPSDMQAYMMALNWLAVGAILFYAKILKNGY